MGGPLSRIVGGATGEGLSSNIRQGYAFIANNYCSGDEIFLIGFSRGAFTARSIAGFIDGIGLLTKAGLPYLEIIFKDFEHRGDRNYQSTYPNTPFPNKPSASDPVYLAELQRRKLTRFPVTIKAIGVWDTVGSLGIPRVGFLEKLGLQHASVKEYTFYDTSLSNCVEHAFQALALDERRSSFAPALWEKTRTNRTSLRQVWFPGVHSNVGGGYEDQELANITLAWMIAQLEQFLDFDPDYIRSQYDENRKYYQQSGQDVRRWSFGEIYKSLMGIYYLAGQKIRTPGNYMRVDSTGQPTSKPLRETNEYIHPSVRTRINLDGPGIEDMGSYDCKALAGYKLKVNSGGGEPGRPAAVWESRARRKGGPRRILPESPLWETERKLLNYSPEVSAYLLEDKRRPNR